MIISEKQIMKLIDIANCMLSRMCIENAPVEVIKVNSDFIQEIVNQQSEELRHIE